MSETKLIQEKSQRKTKKTVFIIIVMLLAIGVGLAIVFQNQLNQFQSVMSLQRVDDTPLYVMHYYGNYGFNEFLQKGLQNNTNTTSQLKSNSDWACSCFAALSNEGDPQFGRNFDWCHPQTLLLFTDPPDAYASVSMVDLYYLGVEILEPSWQERLRLLDAPFWPFDGMNEYGVAIGMMAVPYAEGGGNPQKVTIGSLDAIRLVLDYARNVNEAIALLQNYNIDFTGGPPVHYLIADPAGNSAIVEFLDGEPNIIRNTEPWQVATNFILSGKTPEEAKSSCWRYKIAYESLSQATGLFTPDETMFLLMMISQGGTRISQGGTGTRWSVAYGMKSGDIQVVVGRKYDHVLNFKLEMKTAK